MRYYLKICDMRKFKRTVITVNRPSPWIAQLAVTWQKPRNSDMIKILVAVRAKDETWIRMEKELFLLYLESYLLLQLLLFLHHSLFTLLLDCAIHIDFYQLSTKFQRLTEAVNKEGSLCSYQLSCLKWLWDALNFLKVILKSS